MFGNDPGCVKIQIYFAGVACATLRMLRTSVFGPNRPLNEAIDAVDEATDAGAAYFMVNCAHPDHFSHVLEDADWARRIRGIRCNASRKSHAELDESETLDDGDPVELGGQYKAIKAKMPWLNIVGGCCGSDLRHVTQIARALAA